MVKRRATIVFLLSFFLIAFLWFSGNFFFYEKNASYRIDVEEDWNKENGEKIENISSVPFDAQYPFSTILQKKIISHNLVQSREYSFKLNKNTILPRSEKILSLFALLKNTGAFHFEENGIENIRGNRSVRIEYGLSGMRRLCGCSDRVSSRIREYHVGYLKGFKTLDLKANYMSSANETKDPNKVAALAELPLRLNSEFRDKLMKDKLELDYHVCDSKFSRESRILLPQSYPMESCRDILNIYPDLPMKHPDALLEHTFTASWWVWKHHGYTTIQTANGREITVEIESTFTLQYYPRQYPAMTIFSEESGDFLQPSGKSEWSLRLFSGNHGHDIWDSEAVQIIDEKFRTIVQELDKLNLIVTSDDRFFGKAVSEALFLGMGAEQSQLLYPTPPPSYNDSMDSLVWVEGPDMKIPFVYKEWSEKEEGIITVLYMNSNHQDLGTCVSWLKTLQLTLHVNFAAFDYPGYGIHEGEASEKSIYEAAEAVADHLLSNLNIAPKSLIIMGKNLGCAGAFHVAHHLESKKESLGGLVLMTPFHSLVQIAGTRLKFAKVDLFDNAKKIEKLKVSVFAVHGKNDEVVDIKHGKKTVSKIQNVWKMEELECGFHDIENSDDFLDHLISFVDHVGTSVEGYKPRVLKQKKIPSQYLRTLTVDNWLDSIELSSYAQSFLINGYFSMDVVKTMEELDLQCMEIVDPDKSTILAAIQAMKEGSSPQEVHQVKKEREGANSSTSLEQVSLEALSSIPVHSTACYGPIPVDAEAFSAVMKDHNVLNEKEEILRFASSVNIPYWKDDKDVLLGKGFFGTTYKSTWEGREVIKKTLQYKRNHFAHFCEEAMILTQLKHPNIVEVIGACMDKGSPLCLVSEYIEGMTLESFMIKHAEMDGRTQVRIALEISSALQFLHECQPPVVHKDLTPKNIIITKEKEEVKLFNFGLGKAPSFLHMAPEMFTGNPVDTASDIYSLGFLFYRLITGMVPFEGWSGAEAAARASKMNSRPILPDGISSVWKELITSCWHKNPFQRPTINQVLVSLRDITEEDNSPLSLPTSISLLDTTSLQEKEDLPTFATESAHLLSYQLGVLLSNDKYSDLTLILDGKEYKVHRAILAARSEIFAEMMEANGNQPTLDITEPYSSAIALPILLRYLYTGKLELNGNTVFPVLESAHQLALSQAVQICREHLEEHGIPLSVTAEESVSETPKSEQMKDIKVNLMEAEKNILHVESVLDLLNKKLEKVTSRMNKVNTYTI